MDDIRENSIEWYTGDKRIGLTLTQKRYINAAKKLVDHYKAIGDDRADWLDNGDGSVYCHLPLECLRLAKKTTRGMSDEQKAAARDRLAAARASKQEEQF